MKIITHTKKIRGRLLVVGLTLLALSACLPPQSIEPTDTRALRWPPPPEIPRVVYLQNLKRPEDLGIGRGLLTRVWQGLLGTPSISIQSPHGLKVADNGNLLVADKVLRQVHVFDSYKGRYEVLGSAAGTFSAPIDVAIDERRQQIFVSDAEQAVVKVFSAGNLRQVGTIHHADLKRPTGLAVNPVTDELLIVDTHNSVILRFALDNLRLSGSIGTSGVASGSFHYPVALTVDAAGRIYVIDSLNHRVQIFTAQGEFIRTFGTVGDGPGYFARPKGVAVDSEGNIHVLDAMFDNVQIFDAQGRLLMAYGGPGQAPGRFWLPSAIFIDARDRIYVADTYNQRIQIFQFLPGGELP